MDQSEPPEIPDLCKLEAIVYILESFSVYRICLILTDTMMALLSHITQCRFFGDTFPNTKYARSGDFCRAYETLLPHSLFISMSVKAIPRINK